ncbi:MAG: hypothetical protein AB8G11_13255 [Saprospiraceae bacterium]
MNLKKVVFLLLLVFNFVSCDKDEIITTNPTVLDKSSELTEPVPNFSTPAFPVIALHIIYREYLHENPRITTHNELQQSSFPTYLENRLIELYPEVAYQGMMQTAISEYNTYAMEAADYATATGEIEEAKQLENIPTLQDEIEATAMTQEEIAIWNEFEQYATADKKVKRSELDAIMPLYGHDKSNSFVLLVNLGVTNYVLFRALQSYIRGLTITTAPGYFQGNSGRGRQGDAFRHIFTSMHLRRYVGRPLAQLFGWGNEVRGQNPCRDREMDTHNNRVGRRTQYSTFRNGTSRHDWNTWASRVRTFVNNPSANGVLQDWFTSNPSCATVDSDVANTSTNDYIYYRQ